MSRLFATLFLFFFCGTVVLAEDRDSLILDHENMFKGYASYYANMLHGLRMANGELYHRDSMTCAHLRLPFGTLLQVRNPRNGRSVVVRVTDRGPYSKRFVLDLSRAAARKLGIIHVGYAKMEITPVLPNEIPYRPKKEKPYKMPNICKFDMPTEAYPIAVWQNDSTPRLLP